MNDDEHRGSWNFSMISESDAQETFIYQDPTSKQEAKEIDKATSLLGFDAHNGLLPIYMSVSGAGWRKTI